MLASCDGRRRAGCGFLVFVCFVCPAPFTVTTVFIHGRVLFSHVIRPTKKEKSHPEQSLSWLHPSRWYSPSVETKPGGTGHTRKGHRHQIEHSAGARTQALTEIGGCEIGIWREKGGRWVLGGRIWEGRGVAVGRSLAEHAGPITNAGMPSPGCASVTRVSVETCRGWRASSAEGSLNAADSGSSPVGGERAEREWTDCSSAGLASALHCCRVGGGHGGGGWLGAAGRDAGGCGVAQLEATTTVTTVEQEAARRGEAMARSSLCADFVIAAKVARGWV